MQADVDVATPILSTSILGAQINAGHSKKKKLAWARTYIYPQKSLITIYKEQSETMLNFCHFTPVLSLKTYFQGRKTYLCGYQDHFLH